MVVVVVGSGCQTLGDRRLRSLVRRVSTLRRVVRPPLSLALLLLAEAITATRKAGIGRLRARLEAGE